MSNRLKVKFSDTSKGWIPISVSVGDKNVEIEASDIPKDPVTELISEIENCFLRNTESEAWLHLEPHFYKWHFSPDGDYVELKLYFAELRRSRTMPGNDELKETLELKYRGSHNELLLTLWRALKEFVSRGGEYGNALSSIESRVDEIKRKYNKRMQSDAAEPRR
jgi:hypothetical protein